MIAVHTPFPEKLMKFKKDTDKDTHVVSTMCNDKFSCLFHCYHICIIY